MKSKFKILLAVLLLLVCFAASPAGVLAESSGQIHEGDMVWVGQSYTLVNGDTVEGNLVMIGGTLTTEAGSLVKGDILVMGGTVTLAGKVEGDVVVLGGTGNITESAEVMGNLVSTGGWLYVSPQATIVGTTNISTPDERKFDFSQLFNREPVVKPVRNPYSEVLWAAFRTLALAALAALVVLIFPKPSLNAADTIRSSAAISWVVGFLTVFILPLALVLMAVTIILIPVILVLLFVLLAGIIFGYIVLGLEIGRRLEEMFKATWAPPVAAGIGVAVLTLLLHALNLIFCVGFISISIVLLIALGVVILSRFGSRKYPSPPKSFTSSVMPPGAPPKP